LILISMCPSKIIEQVEDLHLVIEHMVVKTLREMASELEGERIVFAERTMPEDSKYNRNDH
jgi:hypothetical protein